MPVVKSNPPRHEPDKPDLSNLTITDAIRNAAKTVVHAYKAFDWDQLQNDDLDFVHLHFEDDAGLQRANDLILQLATAKPEFIVETRRRYLHLFFQTVRKYVIDCIKALQGRPKRDSPGAAIAADLKSKLKALKANQGRLGCLENDFKRLLDSLIYQQQPNDASQRLSIWKQASAILNEVETVRRTVIEDARNVGRPTRTAPPPPIEPLRFGDSGEHWLSLPLSVFTGRIVGFSNKIVQINTGQRQVVMDGNLVVYEELLTRCGLLRLEIPCQDDVPASEAIELQKKTDRLSEAVHALLAEIPGQTATEEAKRLTQVGLPTISPPEAAQSTDLTAAGEKPGEDAKSKSGGALGLPTVGISPEDAPGIDPACQKDNLIESPITKIVESSNKFHNLTIDGGFRIKVDGEDETTELNRRTLLGLAIYAKDDAAVGFRINTRTFLGDVEGHDVKWSNRWSARCKGLADCLLFSIGDITDLDLFVKNLVEEKPHAVSDYLWHQFSEKHQNRISSYGNKLKPKEKAAFKKEFLWNLNRIVRGPSIYELKRFADFHLSDNVAELIRKAPEGRERIYLNRMLLLAAYPKMIRKRQIFQWFSAQLVADGEYDILGLRFVKKPGPEMIRTYLNGNPFKTRRRRKALGAT